MKRMVSLALAAALGLGTVAATAGSADADPRGRGGWNNCNRGQPCGPGWNGGGKPGWHGGNNWNRPPGGQWAGRPGYGPRPGWRAPPRGYWYGPGYYNGNWYNNSGAALAAGAILGLGIGAAIANSNNGGYEVPPPASYSGAAWNRHVAYCQDRYRSYNVRTDTFTGYDGRTYRCVGSY